LRRPSGLSDSESPGKPGAFRLEPGKRRDGCNVDTWMKVGSALLLGLMLVVLAPRAIQMLRESPRGSAADWRAALVPIVIVVLFVIVLMKLV